MATELAIPKHETTAISVFDRVDPMQFIDTVGRIYHLTGAGGVKSEPEGKLLALACLVKKKDIFEISSKFHLIEGKLTIKADVALANFRTKFGGNHRWIKTGDDGQEAVLELTAKGGEPQTISFSIQRATAAGYVKEKSQWLKRPDQMLRARCISDGIRMVCPEALDGFYTVDEIEDVVDSSPAVSVSQESQPSSAPAKATKRTRAATAAQEPAKPAAEPVAEAEVVKTEQESSAATTTEEKPPFDADDKTPPKSNFNANLLELELLIDKAGTTKAELIQTCNAKLGTSAKTLDDYTEDQIERITNSLRTLIERNANAAK